MADQLLVSCRTFRHCGYRPDTNARQPSARDFARSSDERSRARPFGRARGVLVGLERLLLHGVAILRDLLPRCGYQLAMTSARKPDGLQPTALLHLLPCINLISFRNLRNRSSESNGLGELYEYRTEAFVRYVGWNQRPLIREAVARGGTTPRHPIGRLREQDL
jgi:hypothetical protein